MASVRSRKAPVNFLDLTGKKFGSWFVISKAGRMPNRSITWNCQCDCGNVRVVKSRNLVSGKSKSCGCKRIESITKAVKEHRRKRRESLSSERGNRTFGSIKLSGCDEVAFVDECDFDLVSQYLWHLSTSRYARARDGILMHVLIMGRRDGFQIDHIDGNGLNNRRSNLRWATASQNAANRSPRSKKSKYKGLARERNGKWIARIVIALGRFNTAEEAARAYDVKAKEIWGDFARLNFPEESK